MQRLLEVAPGLDYQTLFQTAVFYNRTQDVEYLLSSFKESIDILENKMFALKHICYTRNVALLQLVIKHGKTQRQPLQITTLLRIPQFIPFVIEHYKIPLDKKLAQKLLEVAIMGNDRKCFEYLIQKDVQDFISDYKYVLVASGAGRNNILLQFIDVVVQLADECVETAYNCDNRDTVNFLLTHVKLTNPSLIERIKEYTKKNQE
jgi:hypothetical protein